MTSAAAGDTVIVKCGTYPTQTITSGTKSAVVTFVAETYTHATTATDAYSATSCATVANLVLDGVDRIHIYGLQATPTPDRSRIDAQLNYAFGGDLGVCPSGCRSFTTTDILVDGFHGRSVFAEATNLTIDHASIGGWDACFDTTGHHLAAGNSGTEDGFRFWTGTGGSPTPAYSVVRNSVFHDIVMGVGDSEVANVCTFGSTLGPHADCMQNNGGSNVTVESNIFFNCPSSDIQWNPFAGATIGVQLIQNNYFGATGGNGTVLGGQGSGWDCSGITVRNNFYDGNGLNPGGSASGCTAGSIAVYGNIFTSSNCIGAGTNYHHNLFTSGAGCGTAPTMCTPVWVVRPAPTLLGSIPNPRLASSDTCARRTNSASAAPTDLDGTTRPSGSSSFGPSEPA